jgi:hypothetical protein
MAGKADVHASDAPRASRGFGRKLNDGPVLAGGGLEVNPGVGFVRRSHAGWEASIRKNSLQRRKASIFFSAITSVAVTPLDEFFNG